MQADQFAALWRSALGPNLSTDSGVLVMVKDRKTGVISTIKSFHRERHEDGSKTIWVEVEEY